MSQDPPTIKRQRTMEPPDQRHDWGVWAKAVAKEWENRGMEQQSHLFDEIKAITRMQMAKEIIEGIQALNIGTYLEAQTVNRAIEVVKGTTGISQ